VRNKFIKNATGAIVFTGIVVVSIVLWFIWSAVPTDPLLTPEIATRLVQRKNVALGYLENQSVAEALPILEELFIQLPADRLAIRNLAVARIVAFGDAGQMPTTDLLDVASRAINSLKQREGESIAYHWLAAKLSFARGDKQAAASHYRDLVKQSPDDAAAWYELSRVQRGIIDEGTLSNESLDRACSLEPNNLWLVVEWFRATSARLAETLPSARRDIQQETTPIERGSADPILAEAITKRWQAITPFADSIETFTKVNVRTVLDQAVTAATNGEMEIVTARLRGLANVLVPQTEGDRRAIERHPLEFVIDQFDPEFYAAYGLSESEVTPLIPVSFECTEPFAVHEMYESLKEKSHAILLEDIDLDGYADVIVLGADTVRVFGRKEGSQNWREIASAEVPAGSTGLIAADLDLDFDEARHTQIAARPSTDSIGIEIPESSLSKRCPAADLDLVVYGESGTICFENILDRSDDSRTLQPFAASGLSSVGGVSAATVADLDADGDLDLVTADKTGIRLWSNRGKASFEEQTIRAALLPIEKKIESFVAIDWDRDVDVDIVFATNESSGWLENLRHGQFRFVPFDSLPHENSASISKNIVAVDVLDADSNASWDLLVGGSRGVAIIQTHRTATGVIRHTDNSFENRTLSDEQCRGLLSLDYDNDGVLDVVTWNDDEIGLWRGLADATFEKADILLSQVRGVHSIDVADVDGDGDLDFACAGETGVVLFENKGGNSHHWLDVSLEAQQIKGAEFSASGRVNAHGIGSLLELKTAMRYQPRSVRRRTTHFGLGTQKAADVVRVYWLNGVPQNIIEPAADLFLCEQQILLGSCPYLYTWNGTEFVFATDLLWNAPLGLQRAQGDLMPSREWEYLKLSGDSLVARDGQYVLQLTEELWEAAYFDQMQLLAVDHPADVEMYSNEKVGPPQIAQRKVHTVRTPRSPVSAHNHRGRDLLLELLTMDENYMKPFDIKLRQGLVEEYFIELDLGKLENPGLVTLFLTGWTYPTTVNLNVALSQDLELPLPVPPSLSVPDGSGGWKTVMPFMGFPGGKTKTIAVDLSGLLASEDSRIRIYSSMEMYWDSIFFTCGEEPAPMAIVNLELVSANLHQRGYSRIEHIVGNGPEQFFYNAPLTATTWPPMQGRFTRFGEVSELLTEIDDRLLVLGAGDEVTLRFALPADPPHGWKRDFLLKSVGWDKDANLATAAGQSVEPMPFVAMRSYPQSPDESLPDSEDYKAYLQEYQTRMQTEDFWQLIRRGSRAR